MKVFIVHHDRVHIENDGIVFEEPLALFRAREPGFTWEGDLFWSPTLTIPSPGPDCFLYVEACATYQPQAIWAHVALSADRLCITDSENIAFSAALRAGNDPASALLPISQGWAIRLRHEDDLAFDSIWLEFVDGEATKTYTPLASLPLGGWHLHEEDFDAVAFGGVTYSVKLAAPVEFTVYRRL